MKHRRSLAFRRNEAGLSLLVVLIALLIISFAAIALLRSSDTGTLVAGNLAFQKTALASGDAGTEEALTWLAANSAGNTLFDDVPARGYYATTADNCDLTGTRTPADAADDVNWTGIDPGVNCNMDAVTVVPPAGVAADFSLRQVINRVCNAEGNPNSLVAADGVTPMACSSFASGASENSTRIGASYGNAPLTGLAQTYYRVTTRIDGPRNTVRYVQALIVL